MLCVTQKDLTNREKLDFAQLDMKRIIRNMKKI